MELRQLRYFVAVAEDLHFGKAARRLHISQPPLSQQIMNLEDEIGAKLFIRTSRSVALTPEGEFFLGEARSILRRVASATNTVGAMARGEEGCIRVGFVAAVTQTSFSCSVREFCNLRPGVKLDLDETSTNDQLVALAKGDLDVAMIRVFNHDLSAFEHREFLREPYLMAVPASHELAQKIKGIHLADLCEEPLVMFSRGFQPDLYDTIMARFNEHGIRPLIAQETNRRTTALALVAAKMGCTPIPASMQKLRRDGVAYLPILDPFPDVRISVVWKKENESPLLNSFLDVLDNYRWVNKSAPDAAQNACTCNTSL